MASKGNQPEPNKTMQESIGGSHSPQQSVRGLAPAREAPMAIVLRERRYDKLQKMGAKDCRGTTNPLEAESWLQRTESIFE